MCGAGEDGAGEMFSLTPPLSFAQTPRINCVPEIHITYDSKPQELTLR